MAIILRKITDNVHDTELCVKLLNENIQNFYHENIVTVESHLRFLKKYFARQDEIIWIIEQNGEGIGIISLVHLDLHNKKSEWGRFVLSKRVRGQGLGVLVLCGLMDYAFANLGLNKLYCEALEENKVAISLYTKLGFEKEGKFKDWIYKNGKFKDVVFLSLSAANWEKLHKPRFAEVFANQEVIVL